MKLKQFTPDQIAKNEFYYNELKNYYLEIPKKYKILYKNCELSNYNYLNENLFTHNVELLKKKLKEIYKNDIISFHDYVGIKYNKSFYIKLNQFTKILDLYKILNKDESISEFFNLLEFFNYHYSNYQIINKNIYLYIEPIYSENKTEYFNKLHRQAYHFTNKTKISSILKTGLRIKERNDITRSYPKRIYIWAYDKNLKMTNELNKFFKNLFGNNYDINDIGIIKLDLFQTTFPVYKDTAMYPENALFLYNNIPAKFCKEIKMEI